MLERCGSAPATPGRRALLPYQGRWVASGLGSRVARVRRGLRLAKKSRRVGITWAEALRQTMIAANAPGSGGSDCYYSSTSQVLGREYVATAATWALALEAARPGRVLATVDAAGRPRQAIQVDSIHFASGHTLRAISSSPAAFRGVGGDVVIDEAAHHVDLEAILAAASAVGIWSMTALSLISTPNGREEPFARLCAEVEAGRRRGTVHRVTLPDAVDEGLFRRICSVNRVTWTPDLERAWVEERLREPAAGQEYLCEEVAGGAAYLRRELVEAAMSTDLRVLHLERSATWELRDQEERIRDVVAWLDAEVVPLLRRLDRRLLHCAGMDFARSLDGDLSVLAVVEERPDLLRSVPLVIELRGVPYQEQWEVLRRVLDELANFAGIEIDGNGNGGWIAETARHYFGEALVRGATMTAEWKAAAFARLRHLLEERRLRLPADADLLADARLVETREGKVVILDKRGTSSKDGRGRHADGIVAVACALHSTREDPPLDLGSPSPGWSPVESIPRSGLDWIEEDGDEWG